MNIFYVYEHWRLDKEECFYVGKGTGNRAYRKGRNDHWNNIVAKLNRIGSGYEVRLVAVGLTEEEAFDLEKERISFWRDLVDLANMTDGGDGLSNPSQEVREKIAAKATGRKHKEETLRLMSQLKFGKESPRKGKKNSEEHRRKISESKKGKQAHNKGKKASDETRVKLSMSHKGKIGNMLGKKHTEDARIRMSESAKKRWSLVKTGETK